MPPKEELFKEIATTITNVIKTYSLTAEKQIDEKYKSQLAHSIFILTKIFLLLKIVADRPKESEVSNELFESQVLIWQAGNSMLAALQLIRQGYPLEPQFLMRVAIESFSLAISISREENAYLEYKEGKLYSNKSIAIAKKTIGEVGKIYGLLSAVTHPSQKTVGYDYDTESKSIIIGGGYTEKMSYRTIFSYSLLNYLLLTIWKGTELIFFEFETNPSIWTKNNTSCVLKLDDSIKQIVATIKKDFEDAISVISSEPDN